MCPKPPILYEIDREGAATSIHDGDLLLDVRVAEDVRHVRAGYSTFSMVHMPAM
jgi:hypothetical protein